MDISLNPVTNLDARLDSGVDIDISLFPITEALDYELDHVEEFEIDMSSSENLEIDMFEYDLYPGPYEAVSKCWRDQEFDTASKMMLKNFVVKEITYVEAPNASGGITVTIGEL